METGKWFQWFQQYEVGYKEGETCNRNDNGVACTGQIQQSTEHSNLGGFDEIITINVYCNRCDWEQEKEDDN